MRLYLFTLFIISGLLGPHFSLVANNTDGTQAKDHMPFFEQIRQIKQHLAPYVAWPQEPEHLLCLEPLEQLPAFDQLVTFSQGAQHEREAAQDVIQSLLGKIKRSMQTTRISTLKDCAVGSAQVVLSPALALVALHCDVSRVIQAGAAVPLCAVAFHGLKRAYTATELFCSFDEIQEKLQESRRLLEAL